MLIVLNSDHLISVYVHQTVSVTRDQIRDRH